MGLFLYLNMAYWHRKKKIPEDRWQEMLDGNTKFGREIYEQAEEKTKLFSKNIKYLLKKNKLSQADLEKRLSEHGMNFKSVRIKVLETYHGRYPSLLEMCFLAKFFGLSDPSVMISRDLEAYDRFTAS